MTPHSKLEKGVTLYCNIGETLGLPFLYIEMSREGAFNNFCWPTLFLHLVEKVDSDRVWTELITC